MSFPTDGKLKAYIYITLTSVEPWDPYSIAFEPAEVMQTSSVISEFTCYGWEIENSLQAQTRSLATLPEGEDYDKLRHILRMKSMKR